MADDFTTGSPDSGSAPSGGADPTPAPITLTDDARFVPPGGTDPVTWKDYSSGFVPKSELTRMRQQDAATLERDRAQLRKSAELLAQRLHAPHTAQGPQVDPFAELEQQPYLDGKTAAGMARQIVQQGLQPLAQAIQHRDQVIGVLHKRLESLEKGYGTMSGQRAESDFQSLISRTLSGLGYPDNKLAAEIATDIYHSHEGWDSEPGRFEAMVKERIDGMRAMVREQDKKRADEARQTRFVPQGPSRPGLAPGRAVVNGAGSAEELSKQLWTGLQRVNS